MSILDTILALLAPHDCLGCSSEGKLLCDECTEKLNKVKSKHLDSTFLPFVHSVTSYEGAAKDLIWKLKSSGAQEAAKIMASLMLRCLPKTNDLLIVPVPTATSRVRQRGYDQARLLARQLARQARLPYLNCLARHGQAHQVGAGREQRIHQLSGVFRVKSNKKILNARIILVDDVVTTGATLEIAAKVLLQAGAQEVHAITFAQPKLRILK